MGAVPLVPHCGGQGRCVQLGDLWHDNRKAGSGHVFVLCGLWAPVLFPLRPQALHTGVHARACCGCSSNTRCRVLPRRRGVCNRGLLLWWPQLTHPLAVA